MAGHNVLQQFTGNTSQTDRSVIAREMLISFLEDGAYSSFFSSQRGRWQCPVIFGSLVVYTIGLLHFRLGSRVGWGGGGGGGGVCRNGNISEFGWRGGAGRQRTKKQHSTEKRSQSENVVL